MSSSQLGGEGGGGRGRERKAQSQSHPRGPRASKESHPVGAVTLFPGRHWPAVPRRPSSLPREERLHTLSKLSAHIQAPWSPWCLVLLHPPALFSMKRGNRQRGARVAGSDKQPSQDKRKSRGEAGPWGWASCRIPSFIKYRKVG